MISRDNWDMFAAAAAGVLLGVVWCKLVYPTHEGRAVKVFRRTWPPVVYEGSVILELWKTRALHVHHWVVALLLVVVLLATAPTHPVSVLALFFFLVVFVQGTAYSDWLKFVVESPYRQAKITNAQI
jgi:hypothetical protein